MAENIETKRARCFFSHANCGVLIDVDKDTGKIVDINGEPNNPVSRGKLCERCTIDTVKDYHYNPSRVDYPLKRVGKRGEGKWERISWDQALDEIAAKLAQLKNDYGPETLACIPQGTYRSASVTGGWRFMYAFGSPNLSENGQTCFSDEIVMSIVSVGDSCLGEFGVPGKGSKCVVMPGRNINESGDFPEYWGYQDMKAEGAKFIFMDPRYTESIAEFGDIWLQLRPGTDSALMLSMAYVIINEDLYDRDFVEKWCWGFDALVERVNEYPPEKVEEITWVPAEKIREAARTYATLKPAALNWGEKLDGNGKNVASNCQMRTFLRALTGNLDIEGGNKIAAGLPTRDLPEISMFDRLPEEQKRKRLGIDRHPLMGEIMNYMHIPDIPHAILTQKPYPIKAYIGNAHEPLLAQNNSKLWYEALKSPELELHVSMTFFMRPSAMLADYVLPATDWTERPVGSLGLWGTYDYIMIGDQAVEPEAERKDDWWFYRELGCRLGQEADWPMETLAGWWEYVVEPYLEKENITYDEFLHDRSGLAWQEFEPKKYEKINPETGAPKGFNTPSGRVEFSSNIIKSFGFDPLPKYVENPETPVGDPELAKEYPLILITGSRVMPFYHTDYREVQLRKLQPYPETQIHPQTARDLGIGAGEWMIIESPRGRIRQKAKLTPQVPPGVVNVQHDWWFPEEIPDDPILYRAFESNANVLTPGDDKYCDDPLGSWPYTALLCKAYPAPELGTTWPRPA